MVEELELDDVVLLVLEGVFDVFELGIDTLAGARTVAHKVYRDDAVKLVNGEPGLPFLVQWLA